MPFSGCANAAYPSMLAGLGARVHVFVRPKDRERFLIVFRDVLKCSDDRRAVGAKKNCAAPACAVSRIPQVRTSILAPPAVRCFGSWTWATAVPNNPGTDNQGEIAARRRMGHAWSEVGSTLSISLGRIKAL